MSNHDANDPETCSLTHEQLEKVLSTIDIPVCPEFVVQAMTEAQKDEPDIARLAALIARRQFGISPDAAYTYALFHDAAIPTMMNRFKEYGQLLEDARSNGQKRVDAESSYFPCTHPVIGSLMVRNWDLPPILGLAIRFHHEPDIYELPDATLPGGALSFIAITQIAEHLSAAALGEVDIDVGGGLFDKALAFLGISDGELDDLRQCVVLALNEV